MVNDKSQIDFDPQSIPFPERNYRRVICPNSNTGETTTLNVMQYNILAEGLANRNEKTGFAYANCDSLNFGYRSLRIIKEISEANPDILCMQEFNYHRIYTPLLNKLDYDLEHYLQEKKYL